MRTSPRWYWVLAAIVCLWAFSSLDGEEAPASERGDGSPRAEQVEDRTGRDARPDRADRDRRTHSSSRPRTEKRDTDRGRTRDKPRNPVPDPRPKPRPQPAQRTYVVVDVIDGDTVDLGNGDTVRLVGIDTPEVGECGYEAARDALARIVAGRPVRLGMSDEDRDGYGRLLRYVDAGSTDAGLSLIRQGLAIARYDSRDGYGFHPREPRYVAADRGTKPVCPRSPVGFAGTRGGSSGSGGGGGAGARGACAPGYHPCVPPGPPDVDCADVNGPVRVSGSDPHGLDGDGDGVACE